MTHKFSDAALTFRALILAEIEERSKCKVQSAKFFNDEDSLCDLHSELCTSPWRTWSEWQVFSTLGANTYMVASTELGKYDPTLEWETDKNSLPRRHRWKLKPETTNRKDTKHECERNQDDDDLSGESTDPSRRGKGHPRPTGQ
jgi:hypothetical protein